MNPKITAALARRAFLRSAETNALRLIDGAGDGFPPACFVEDFAGHLLLSTPGPTIPPDLRAWLRNTDVPAYHKRLDQHQKDSPTYLSGPKITQPFPILENGASFEISFQSGYSQGIFLDQRNNRAEVRNRASSGQKILNTFAYTGAFSVVAALGGAETTTLDLSQPYLEWAKRNFRLNHLDPAAHHFCKGDTFHWLRRFARQGRKFDGIVLDPPTFSRDESGKVFRASHDFGTLAAMASAILNPGGWLLCCTNFHGISPHAFERLILADLPRSIRTRHALMPADFTAPPYLKSLWLEH